MLVLQDAEVRERNLITAEQYARISSPTLVVWTSHDPTATAAEGRRLASMVHGSQFELMEGCAHWPQFEDPDSFNALALAFLSAQLKT